MMALARLQVRQRRACHVEVAEDVGPEGALQLLVGELLEAATCFWKAALLTRMSSRPSSRTVRSTASRQNAGSVTSPGISRHRPALRLDRPARLLGVGLLRGQVDDRHVRPFAGEEHRHGPADARVAAGDQRHLVLQLARSAVLGGLVSRARLEVALEPRLAELLLRHRRLGVRALADLYRAVLLRLLLLAAGPRGLGFLLQLPVRARLGVARRLAGARLLARPPSRLSIDRHESLLKIARMSGS